MNIAWKHRSDRGLQDRTAPNPLGRMLAVKIFLLVVFVIVTGRLVQIQVVESATYQEVARRQYEDRLALRAKRGEIYDRKERSLVSSVMDVSIGADPRMIGSNSAVVARRLARMFSKPPSYYLAKLSGNNTNFVYIERHVDPLFGQLLEEQKIDGLILVDEPRRVYHNDAAAGQVLGFTDIDGHGISGVELQVENMLRGQDGHVVLQRDGLGRKFRAVDYPHVNALHGNNVVLALDRDQQAVAEEELRKGVATYNAEGGLVVILEPSSGEVLAMANYPAMDPADPGRYSLEVIRNRAVTDMFEPGSAFKIVTAAAALEHGIVAPEQKFYAEQGQYNVVLAGGKNRVITDLHQYGTLTFREAIEFSSNIVMAKVSDLIGVERMYRTARDFGFGTETGVDLPGEISGDLKRPTQWWGTTLNSISYGYDVGVTPLQLAAAYAAIANGGTLYKPSIVKRVVGQDKQVLAETKPQLIRRVISTETARTITQFLVGVVERGTGKAARVEGMTIAGKTGTARKVVGGKYVQGSYTATFAGFFPAENPKAVCVVMIDTRSSAYTGGLVAAPIFRNIARKIIGLSEQFSEEAIAGEKGAHPLSVPDVVNLQAGVATSFLEETGFNVQVSGKGEFVSDQDPRPGTRIFPDVMIHLKVTDLRPKAGIQQVVLPDIRNLPLRRAMNRLRTSRLEMIVEGSGRVVAQRPAPGEHVGVGTPVHVVCRPGKVDRTSLKQ